MAFSESLTVRILGDSSGLQRELDGVLNRLDDLREKFTASADSANQLTRSFAKISQAISPLQRIGSLLARIQQQLRSISQQPLTLNVSPALQALQQLSQAARQAAMQIQMIPSIPVGGAGPATGPFPLPPLTPTPSGPRQRFAGGGLVVGPQGIDKVTTQLTAGEYVLSRSAVESLGIGLLEQLNSIGGQRLRSPSVGEFSLSERRAVRSLNPHQAFPGTSSNQGFPRRNKHENLRSDPRNISQVTNHFGEISIQVSDQIDAESLLKSLRVQGFSTRNRQG